MKIRNVFFSFVLFLLCALSLFLAACHTPAPVQTPDATRLFSPTVSVPTATTQPTPIPTETLWLTSTPFPTRTPPGTSTPYPTHTLLVFDVTWYLETPAIPLDVDYPFLWANENTLLEFNWDSLAYDAIEFTDSGITTIQPAQRQPPVFQKDQHVSPSGKFRVQCQPDSARLIFTEDGLMLSETGVEYCNGSFFWSPDESAVAIVYPIEKPVKTLVVWNTDGSSPQEIANGVYGDLAAWSLDSQKLAVGFSPTVLGNATVIIVQRTGEIINHLETKYAENNTLRIVWLSNELLEVSAGRGTGKGSGLSDYSLFDVPTGFFLNSYEISTGVMAGTFVYGQTPKASPDYHWLLLDNTVRYASYATFDYKFTLLDTIKQTSSVVMEAPDTFWVVLGWANNAFYLLQLPANRNEMLSSETMGVYSLEPNSQKLTLRIPGAYAAYLSPNQDAIFALTPNLLADGETNAEIAVYNLTGKRISETINVVKQIQFGSYWRDHYDLVFPYLRTGILDEYGDWSPLQVMWSHDGNQLVMLDTWNKLWLFNVNGKIQQLADVHVPEGAYFTMWFSWSPNDTNLIADFDAHTWVLPLH